MAKLTARERQNEVLQFILRYQEQHGEKPSLKVIADECGISISTAGEFVKALKGAKELLGPVFQVKVAGA